MSEFDIIETRDHSIDSQISMIMQNFPFHDVKKIFDYMGYKYMTTPYDEYQPKIEDLQFLAESLLRDAGEKGKNRNMNMTISSGRFEAFWNCDEETLSLKFIPYESEIITNEAEETIYVV